MSNQRCLFTTFPTHCVGKARGVINQNHTTPSHFSIPGPNYLLLSVPCLFNGWIGLTDRGGWEEEEEEEEEEGEGGEEGKEREREKKNSFIFL